MLVDTDDLLNQNQIANLVGLSRERIRLLAKKPDFPKRILRCGGEGGGCIWLKADILKWWEERPIRTAEKQIRTAEKQKEETIERAKKTLKEYEELKASGLKHRQIAEKWGIKPSSVKTKICLYRKRLKGVKNGS